MLSECPVPPRFPAPRRVTAATVPASAAHEPASHSRTRLSGVEALRGIAATTVVLYHVARHVNRGMGAPTLVHATQFGHAGVDLFFVLSGFIILFVHARDIGRPERWQHYVARRFMRVYPTFWVALAITALLGLAGHHATLDPSLMAWSATLLPSVREPILGVAWTLQYEILFYSLFLTLILARRAGITVLAAWLAVILAHQAGLIPIDPRLPASLYGFYNIEFFLGMGVAACLQRRPVPAPGRICLIGVGLLVGAAMMEDAGLLNGYGAPARLAYGVPSALLVLGLVAWERTSRIAPPTWLRQLGSASYSIYLFQFVWIGAAWQVLVATGLVDRLPAAGIFALLGATAIAGGLAASRWVEKPLAGLRLRR